MEKGVREEDKPSFKYFEVGTFRYSSVVDVKCSIPEPRRSVRRR